MKSRIGCIVFGIFLCSIISLAAITPCLASSDPFAGDEPFDLTTITAVVAANNYYELYLGNADGGDLTSIGGNGPDWGNSSGLYDIGKAYVHSGYELGSRNYVYVIVWDAGGAQALIGGFYLFTNGVRGDAIITNTTDWEYSFLSSSIADLTDLGAISASLEHAAWQTPLASGQNDSDPWGYVRYAPLDAQFIWGGPLGDSSGSDGHYVVFRTQLSAVPIPGSLWLLGSALVGLPAIKRRFFA
jgi:hypothetical protein